MNQILLEPLERPPVGRQRVELVERKGTGHPDTICDGIMEAVSLALCREYLSRCGRILHHNVDKGLLVAGRSAPRPGGGRILEPMRLVLGDRATAACDGAKIDVGAIAAATAAAWLRDHLRYVDPERHLVVQNELKEGAAELTDIFQRQRITANDTSIGVGYAPLTETEEMVLAAERYLNSPSFHRRFPEAGEDVKVMGLRQDRELRLTVALAFVDRYVADSRAYFARKEEIAAALGDHLVGLCRELDGIGVEINTLDDAARGEAGMYLTVLGTSAEGGDGGQVGRGNRVNGLISPMRPMSTEAAAGKNPVSHVGKIYNLLAHRMAAQIHAAVPAVREVSIWLLSQIGRPVAEPLSVSGQLLLEEGADWAETEAAAAAVIGEELAAVDSFIERLVHGELPVW